MVTIIPNAPYKLFSYGQSIQLFKIYESLDWFGPEMRSRIWINIENWKKQPHHKDKSFLENCINNSHCSLQTLLLWTKYPILLKYMNLWTDSKREWGLASESKSKIERIHLHHNGMYNLVNSDTNPHWPLKTLLFWQSIQLYVNIWISGLICPGNVV